MENFLKDKDIWIVGSVCLVASFLWRRIWNLFIYKRKRERDRDTPFPDMQVQIDLFSVFIGSFILLS